MPQTSENSHLITRTLQHFGVLTSHLERMVDWYAKVVGMITRYSGSRGSAGASVTFLSNYSSHHRLAIITMPELQEDTDKKVHTKLQHIAFEYATIDDLLNSYARVKGLGIEPVLTTDHGQQSLSTTRILIATSLRCLLTWGTGRDWISTRTRWAPS